MIVCIIQARTDSTRLLGKVVKLILGRPMLALQIERIKRSSYINKIIVATTIKKEDDQIEFLAKEANVLCFRGSEIDVLDRYYQIAKEVGADIVVRITGDCPLSDPKVIDETIDYFLKNIRDIDYTSKPTNYPEGLDVEVFSFSALERAWKEGLKPSEREHVTPYIYTHPEIFRVRTWKSGQEDFSKMHWSVDTPEDFIFVTKIFEKLYPQNSYFSKNDVIGFLLENKELLDINRGGTGSEGYVKSQEEDKLFQEKQELYERMISFIPEVIVLVSGGIVKENVKDNIVKYRSTKIDEGDAFGVLWGEARVLATAELATYFPKVMTITTSIHSGELEKLSISRNRIILEEKSKDTLSQISEAMKIVYKKGLKRIVFITNEYHLPRIRTMYEYFELLSQSERETKTIIHKIKNSDVKVGFVAAEPILLHRDKKFIKIIDRLKKSPAYLKRLENENRGIKMIKSGEYGKKATLIENKLEREV